MIKNLTITFATAQALAIGTQAATIVQWGERAANYSTDIVSSNPNNSAEVGTFTGAVSNPTVGATYYPNAAGRTPIFNVTSANTPDTSRVLNQASGDRLDLSDLTIANGEKIELMYVWGAAVTGGTSQFLTGDSTLESLSLSGFSTNRTNFTNELRFIIRKDGNWFASQNLGIAGGYSDRDIADTSLATWSAFTPITGGSATVGLVTPIDMTNVDSVGFYLNQTNNSGASNSVFSNFAYFEATAVPEPSALALLGLGAIGLFARRRR